MSEILRRIGDDYIDYDGEDIDVVDYDDNYDKMQQELEMLDNMSEIHACAAYNVDNKEEARQLIIEYWSCTEEKN